ncbi:MAG TPA: protein kinase [Gemmatimonadales bacterium]|nr:protein kinase [Gemmatimonadales bacterium]
MATILTCPHCATDLGPGDRFCPQCGAGPFVCAGCSEPLLEGALSCPACGTPAYPTAIHETDASPEDEQDSPWTEVAERLRRATLGEFEIGRELGRGGMAAVFLAHEISLARKVAIKVMSPGLLMGDGMIDRFKREAITIAHLNHPNIVSVHSVRQAEGLHFFVMRYIQGRSLEQVIDEAGRLPIPIVRSILCQVASALTYAHRSRVVHRDIKPANILIDEDGNAVVTDFGIAKAAESPTQTHSGALVGTPAYMSPEQVRGAEVSGASDQYALGAVAYQMITGIAPFAGSTITVMQAQLQEQPRPIREIEEDCPPDLEAAILRMLAKDPDARWPSMAEAKVALGAVPLTDDDPLRAELIRLATTGHGSSLSETPTPVSPAPRTRPSASLRTPAAGLVQSVTILPPPPVLEAGDRFMLVAQVRGQHGVRLPGRMVEWSSDTPDVLRVDSDRAMATALAPGSARLSAICDGVEALHQVEVAPPTADEISIAPLDQPVRVGDEVQLEATARSKHGQPIARPVTWQSADPAIATLARDGVLSARSAGSALITAELDDARKTMAVPIHPALVAAIRISPPPKSVTAGESFVLSATPLDRRDEPLPDRTVFWTTSDVGVAVIMPSGWVGTLGPGTAVLTATCERASASITVNVEAVARPPAPAPTPPEATSVPPRPPAKRRRMARSRRSRLLAACVGAMLVGGWVWLSGRVYSSRAPDAESADLSSGSRASAESGSRLERFESMPVVDSGAPAAVAITRQPRRLLAPGAYTRAMAELRDLAGRPVRDSSVVWSSTDPAVARVDPARGWVHAIAPGRAHVVAASGAWRDSVMVVVRAPAPASAAAPAQPEALPVNEEETKAPQAAEFPAAVASVSVVAPRTLVVGETVALRAELRDQAGGGLSWRRIAWTSSDPEVAAVDPVSGVVAAYAPGTTEITATSEGQSGRVSLTVLPPVPDERSARPADQVERPPTPAGSRLSERQQLEARIRSGVEQCYAALRAKDASRVAQMYRPGTKLDQENLKRLTRILRTDEWEAAVGERTDGARQIGTDHASAEFSFHLAWRDAFGGRLGSDPVFRAEFARDGSRYTMSSCRIVGSPDL